MFTFFTGCVSTPHPNPPLGRGRGEGDFDRLDGNYFTLPKITERKDRFLLEKAFFQWVLGIEDSLFGKMIPCLGKTAFGSPQNGRGSSFARAMGRPLGTADKLGDNPGFILFVRIGSGPPSAASARPAPTCPDPRRGG